MKKPVKHRKMDDDGDYDGDEMPATRGANTPGMKAAGKTVTRNDISPADEEDIDRRAGEQPKLYKGGSGRDVARVSAEEREHDREDIAPGNNPHHSSARGHRIDDNGVARIGSHRSAHDESGEGEDRHHHIHGAGTYGHKKTSPGHPHNHPGGELSRYSSGKAGEVPDGHDHLKASRYFGGGDGEY